VVERKKNRNSGNVAPVPDFVAMSGFSRQRRRPIRYGMILCILILVSSFVSFCFMLFIGGSDPSVGKTPAPRPRFVPIKFRRQDPNDRFVASSEFYRRELTAGVEPLPDFALEPTQGRRCTPGLCDGGCKLCCSRYGWCGSTDDHCIGEGTMDCRKASDQGRGVTPMVQTLEAVLDSAADKSNDRIQSDRTEQKAVAESLAQLQSRDSNKDSDCADVVILTVPRSETRVLHHAVNSTFAMARKAAICLRPVVIVMRPDFLQAVQNTSYYIERRRDWGAHPVVMAKPVMQQQRDIINMLEVWKQAERCRGQFVLMEDDFTWCEDDPRCRAHVRKLLTLATTREQHTWSAVKFSHGLGGVMIQCRDIPALQQHLETFMGSWPPDALVGEFLAKDCKEGRWHFKARRYLSFRYNLLRHTAKASTLGRDPRSMAGHQVDYRFPLCGEEVKVVNTDICSNLNLAAECFLGDQACLSTDWHSSDVDAQKCLLSAK